MSGTDRRLKIRLACVYLIMIVFAVAGFIFPSDGASGIGLDLFWMVLASASVASFVWLFAGR